MCITLGVIYHLFIYCLLFMESGRKAYQMKRWCKDQDATKSSDATLHGTCQMQVGSPHQNSIKKGKRKKGRKGRGKMKKERKPAHHTSILLSSMHTCVAHDVVNGALTKLTYMR